MCVKCVQRYKAKGVIHFGGLWGEPGGEVGTRQSKDSLPKAQERARQTGNREQLAVGE